MTTFFVGLLTAVLVLNCVLLILLVLVQLPKKDAGAGIAFGGGAADAIFGAGSGTALTRLTKYVAASFFIVALALSLLQQRIHDPARILGDSPAAPAATEPAPDASNVPVLPDAPPAAPPPEN